MTKNKFQRIITTLLIVGIMMSMTVSSFAFDKVIYANADPYLYQIELDLVNKVVTVFERDNKGKYTKIAKQFICTTGTNETPTPSGSFKLNDSRRRFGYFTKFDCYAQYWVNVSGGIYFHSILYTKPKEGYFTRTSFNALGTQASHGCIRLLVEDARWLYYNCPAGTYGVIRNDKAKDSALTKSLKPTVSYSNYKPESDQYENTKRGYPVAVVKTDTTFTATTGIKYKVQENTPVRILSSGRVNCRVTVAGVEGHIDTADMEFIPNGPSDQSALKKMTTDARYGYYISADESYIYSAASVKKETLGVYGKGTDLERLGSTASFYQVKVDGITGYILKSDVTTAFMLDNGKKTVNKIDEEALSEETMDSDDEDDFLTIE